MNVKPDFLEGEVALHELGVQLGHEEKVLFEEGTHGIAEGVGDEAELKVDMHVHEFLDYVVVAADGEDLVY